MSANLNSVNSGFGGNSKISAGSQYIDTEIVEQYAEQLNQINQTIDEDFDSFKSTAVNLEDTWRSAAGTKACTLMYQLFSLSESRSNVISNYVNVFKQQVDPNYISAENTNTSLADEFK